MADDVKAIKKAPRKAWINAMIPLGFVALVGLMLLVPLFTADEPDETVPLQEAGEPAD
ncbi:MAG: hypothetical protein ACU0BF_07440 [Paracoccaceae bacterium]